jgi:hypothetical protein
MNHDGAGMLRWDHSPIYRKTDRVSVLAIGRTAHDADKLWITQDALNFGLACVRISSLSGVLLALSEH